MLIIFVFYIYILSTLQSLCCNALSDEARLHRDLAKVEYYQRARPVKNSSQVVNVTLNLQILSLTMNMRKQRLMSSIWLEQRWKDELIFWNKSDYGGIYSVFVDETMIWRPDIMIRNHVGMRMRSYDDELFIPEVTSTGDVLYWPASEITTKCDVDVSYYPFDTQHCDINVGKWYSYDAIVSISPGILGIDLTFYTESKEWEVVGNKYKIKVDIENSVNYSQIVYTISLKRRPLFYVVNIILPVFFLSLLSNTCFLLPIQSGEKIGMCMAIFLTFAVFLTLINESLPQSSKGIPMYGMYLLFQNFLSALTIGLEVFVIHVHQTKTENNPKAKTMLKFLETLLCTSKLKNQDHSFLNESDHDLVFTQNLKFSSLRKSGIQTRDFEVVCNTHSDDKIKASSDNISEHIKDNTLCQNETIRWMNLAVKLDNLFGRLMFSVNITSFLIFIISVSVYR